MRCLGLPFCRLLKLGTGVAARMQEQLMVPLATLQACSERKRGKIPHWWPSCREPIAAPVWPEKQWQGHRVSCRLPGPCTPQTVAVAGGMCVFPSDGKVFGLFPLLHHSLWSHETLLWASSWRMGSRGQACSVLYSAGCLCPSLTSVPGYLCFGNVDRWAETNRPQHGAHCKSVAWNSSVRHHYEAIDLRMGLICVKACAPCLLCCCKVSVVWCPSRESSWCVSASVFAFTVLTSPRFSICSSTYKGLPCCVSAISQIPAKTEKRHISVRPLPWETASHFQGSASLINSSRPVLSGFSWIWTRKGLGWYLAKKQLG